MCAPAPELPLFSVELACRSPLVHPEVRAGDSRLDELCQQHPPLAARTITVAYVLIYTADSDAAARAVATDLKADPRPWVVFLEGGPGFPTSGRLATQWALHELARAGWMVLIMDQRGTGKSMSLTAATLDDVFGTDAPQVATLVTLRADSIVLDAECARRLLLGDDRSWVVMGLSFGGFASLTYLSIAPQHLDGAIIIGGVPSLDRPAAAVYARTFTGMEHMCDEFYARYPDARLAVAAVLAELRRAPLALPDGGTLTAARLRLSGWYLVFMEGPRRVYQLIMAAVSALKLDVPGLPPIAEVPLERFLANITHFLVFDMYPLYAVMHESIYCQGAASAWAAEAELRARAASSPRWEAAAADAAQGAVSPALAEAEAEAGPLLLGEAVLRHAFADFAGLRGFAAATDALHAWDSWPALYDTDQLARNRVPTVALAFLRDRCVPIDLTRESAARVGCLDLCVHESWDHSAMRDDPTLVHALVLRMRAIAQAAGEGAD